MGLFPLILLLLVSWNLPFGPWREDYRYRQIKEHMANCYKRNEGPSSCPLFEGMSAKLVQAYEELGEQFSPDRPKEEQVWEWLSQRNHFARQGRRMTLCRFQAVVKGMKERMPCWQFDLFGRTYVALEEDYLRGRGLSQRLQQKASGSGDAVTEGGNTTSAQVLTFEDRAV